MMITQVGVFNGDDPRIHCLTVQPCLCQWLPTLTLKGADDADADTYDDDNDDNVDDDDGLKATS